MLVVSVVGSIITAQIGGNLMDWHSRFGLLILGLLVFRLVWGFVGSTYSRFAQFAPTPTRIIAYWRGNLHVVGHNPLGALSVFAMLLALLLQALLGLFSNDDIAFTAPLYELVDHDWSNWLSGWHHRLANVMYALLLLHVAAIAYYASIKKKNLLPPMLHGRIEATDETTESKRSGGGWLALVIALAIAIAAVYAASGSWISPPPPTDPSSSMPEW